MYFCKTQEFTIILQLIAIVQLLVIFNMKKLSTAFLISLALSVHATNADETLPSNPDGEVAGHGYVDLGLPSGTLWATCNIGAEDYYYPGEYFAWGETQSRGIFLWNNYEFQNEEYIDENGYTNYTATDIGDQISGTEYDAARALWGDAWRMPTKEDYEELKEYCHTEFWEYAQVSPRKGLRVWGPNGKSILFPRTFSPHGGFTPAVVMGGDYWTATVNDTKLKDYPCALKMGFDSNCSNMALTPDRRHDGFSIRPVISRKDISTSVGTLTETVTSLRYENGFISIEGNSSGCQLTVSDLSGRNICRSTADNSTYRLPALSKGVYIITLHKDGKTAGTFKITVK